MQEVSDEEQAAMSLKLMDNVHELIVNTVLEELSGRGALYAAVCGIVNDTINYNHSGSPLSNAVKQIIKDQMGKY